MKVRYVYLKWMKILLSHTDSTKAQEAVQLTHSPETLLPLENCLHTLQTKGVMEEQGGMTPHKTYRQILAQQEKGFYVIQNQASQSHRARAHWTPSWVMDCTSHCCLRPSNTTGQRRSTVKASSYSARVFVGNCPATPLPG